MCLNHLHTQAENLKWHHVLHVCHIKFYIFGYQIVKHNADTALPFHRLYAALPSPLSHIKKEKSILLATQKERGKKKQNPNVFYLMSGT